LGADPQPLRAQAAAQVLRFGRRRAPLEQVVVHCEREGIEDLRAGKVAATQVLGSAERCPFAALQRGEGDAHRAVRREHVLRTQESERSR